MNRVAVKRTSNNNMLIINFPYFLSWQIIAIHKPLQATEGGGYISLVYFSLRILYEQSYPKTTTPRDTEALSLLKVAPVEFLNQS